MPHRSTVCVFGNYIEIVTGKRHVPLELVKPVIIADKVEPTSLSKT